MSGRIFCDLGHVVVWGCGRGKGVWMVRVVWGPTKLHRYSRWISRLWPAAWWQSLHKGNMPAPTQWNLSRQGKNNFNIKNWNKAQNNIKTELDILSNMGGEGLQRDKGACLPSKVHHLKLAFHLALSFVFWPYTEEVRLPGGMGGRGMIVPLSFCLLYLLHIYWPCNWKQFLSLFNVSLVE